MAEFDSKFNLNIISTYDRISFGERYSFDIWISIVVITVVIILLTYLHFINTLQTERANWKANKCNPAYMPFASIINGKDGKFATDNLNECLNILNDEINNEAKKPIDGIFQTIQKMFATASSTIFNFIGFIQYVFAMIIELIKNVFRRIELIVKENIYIFANIVNFLNSIVAIVVNFFNTVLLLIDMLKLSFYIAALCFYSVIVIPAFVAFIVLLIVSIVLSIFAMFFAFLWPWVAAVGVLCVFALVFWIFVILIYICLKNFAIEVLEKHQNNLKQDIANTANGI